MKITPLVVLTGFVSIAVGFASAAGFTSAAEVAGLGSELAGGAAARAARSGRSLCSAFSGFSGFSVLAGFSGFSVSTETAGAVFSGTVCFSVGFSCGGTLPTVVEVFSLLLAKFPSLPGP